MNRRTPTGAGLRTDLFWAGPLDIVSDPATIADVEAVVREAPTNVARHAQASGIRVEVRTDGKQLEVEISETVPGLPSSQQRRSGPANLKRRAQNRGGVLDLENGPTGGLRLRWTVPLD